MLVRARLLCGLFWVALTATGCATRDLREEHPMHAELTTDGGWTAAVPGLAKPIVLDAGDLTADQNAEFARLVSEARAESGAAQGGTHKAIADGQSYRIVIDVDGGNLSLRSADPAVPPGFSALMAFMKAHGHR